MKPTTLGAHFAKLSDAERVRRAAKKLGVSPSAFIREAAEKRADEVLAHSKCPTCGAEHAA